MVRNRDIARDTRRMTYVCMRMPASMPSGGPHGSRLRRHHAGAHTLIRPGTLFATHLQPFERRSSFPVPPTPLAERSFPGTTSFSMISQTGAQAVLSQTPLVASVASGKRGPTTRR